MADARRSSVDATLGAFEERTRRLLVPTLFYKSFFLGDWFAALIEHEPDVAVQDLLRAMARETLGEALSITVALREWESLQLEPGRDEELTRRLQRRALLDMLAIKEGNAEVLVMAAMGAPTEPLRHALMVLAHADRRHADDLRRLLRASAPSEAPPRVAGEFAGVSAGRGREATLGAAIKLALAQMRARGMSPERVVLSPEALRHARDEGVVDADGAIEKIGVDVEFGWSGEAFSIVTAERMALASLLAADAD